MSNSSDQITILRAAEAFENVTKASSGKKQLKPFSMRLSAEERAFLGEHAGGRPWAAYIREWVFGQQATRRRSIKRPRIEDQQLARVLSELGASRLASNVNQLAKLANMGTIDVSEDVEQQLEDAATAIPAMRDALFIALGLKP